MGKVGNTVIGALFVAIGVWVLVTSGNPIFGWGTIALGLAYAVFALVLARRSRKSPNQPDRG